MLGTFITPATRAAWLRAASKEARPLLRLEPSVMAGSYNREPFIVRHSLAGHPAFSLEALSELCRRLPRSQVMHRVGTVPDNTDFDTSLDGRFSRGLTLEDALDHLVERQAYVAVNNPERDDTYRPLIEQLIGEIIFGVRGLDPQVNWFSTYLFISARDSVTPYHMDREMNFLLQIQGRKTVMLWNPMDEAVMTSRQRDRLMSDRSEPRPPYHSGLDALASRHELTPGMGVHHPFIAPHLVRTGAEPSVTLAVTFRTRVSDIRTDAHCCNEQLRKFGVDPSPVGHHPWQDHAKALLIRAARKGKQTTRQMRQAFTFSKAE